MVIELNDKAMECVLHLSIEKTTKIQEALAKCNKYIMRFLDNDDPKSFPNFHEYLDENEKRYLPTSPFDHIHAHIDTKPLMSLDELRRAISQSPSDESKM